MQTRLNWQAGFSLIEMAIVLMILGTLMSGVLVAVSASTETTRRTTARNQLRQLEEALYAYAQTRGALPCPASDTSNGLADGAGACATYHGFVPAATLGFTGAVNADGLLLDPWQNPYRYSIVNNGQSVTISGNLQTLYAGWNAPDLLEVCEDSFCGTTITSIAPVVIFSMGANWANYTSADEQKNSGDGSTTLGSYNIHGAGTDFVSAPYSEEQFDDILVWLSPYVLFGRLIEAGRLP